MTSLTSASYALRRQKLAVERTLCARSIEESETAARWAAAWHRLVQRKLDQAAPVREVKWVGIGPIQGLGRLSQRQPARVLH